jgi:putative endonuclease
VGSVLAGSLGACFKQNEKRKRTKFFPGYAFSDAGSIPAASTSLRQGFGWQAGALTKAVRRSFSEGGPIPPWLCERRTDLQSMHYVYLLRSQSHPEQRYTGLTMDIRARLAKHNEGAVPHTSRYRPWHLQAYIAFTAREQAAEFEQYLKSGSGRAFANRHRWPV